MSLIYEALKLAQKVKLAREAPASEALSRISSLLKLVSNSQTTAISEQPQDIVTVHGQAALDPDMDKAVKIKAPTIAPVNPGHDKNKKFAVSALVFLHCQLEKVRQPTVLWTIVCLVIVTLLSAGLSQLRRRQIPRTFPPSAETSSGLVLGLKVERHTADWQLSWNRNAAAVLNATRGRLLITDGVRHKELDLDPSELQTGSVVYSPMTDSVVLRLELVEPDSAIPISESVRLVTGQSPRVLSQTEVKGASTNQFGAIGRARSSTAQPSAAVLSSASVTEPDKTDKSKTQGSTEHLESAEKPAMVPLPNTSTDSSEQPAPTPPAVNPVQQGGNIDPPERIVGKNPAYPLLAKQSHITGIVEVHFRVNAEGRVYDVHAVKGSPLLVQAAVEAVQAWRYKAAQLNGTAFDSEVSTIFNFSN